MGCVYQAINRINGKNYIGKTIGSLVDRIDGHMRSARHKGHLYFQRALLKYGLENFEWKILTESDDDAILCRAEQAHILEFKTKAPDGYNLTDGGEGLAGYKIPDEVKKKMSLARMGKHRKPFTMRAKLNMSKGLFGNRRRRGKKASKETRARIAKALIGNNYALGKTHTLSKETKERMSVAARIREQRKKSGISS